LAIPRLVSDRKLYQAPPVATPTGADFKSFAELPTGVTDVLPDFIPFLFRLQLGGPAILPGNLDDGCLFSA